jgi:hypothetical protein
MDTGAGIGVRFGINSAKKKLGQWCWGNTIATYSIDYTAIVQSAKVKIRSPKKMFKIWISKLQMQ